MQKHDMNLLDRYNDVHKERSKEFSPARVYIIFLSILCLLLSAFAIRFWLEESMLKGDVKELKSYNQSAVVLSKLAEIDRLKKNINSLDELLSETKEINAVLDASVRFDSIVLEILYYELPKNVGFEAISFSQGVLSIELRATRASDFSNYLLRLERESYFKEVTYESYSYDTSTGLYYSTMRCVMKGRY